MNSRPFIFLIFFIFQFCVTRTNATFSDVGPDEKRSVSQNHHWGKRSGPFFSHWGKKSDAQFSDNPSPALEHEDIPQEYDIMMMKPPLTNSDMMKHPPTEYDENFGNGAPGPPVDSESKRAFSLSPWKLWRPQSETKRAYSLSPWKLWRPLVKRALEQSSSL